jgi:predicted phosphodiesterase
VSDLLDAAKDVEDRHDEARAAKENTDPRLVKLRRLAKELHDEGHDFAIDRGEVYTPLPDRDNEASVDLGSDHYRFLVVSDTHGGSRYEQLSALKETYHIALEEGCEFAIHAGDVTQGSDRMHRGMELEVHAHGADAQAGYVIATYPRGLTTYIIGGNHDASFAKDGGVNVVRKVCSLHPDLEYLGQDAAYLNIGPSRHYIIHPSGGGAYAKSYKGQKIAETTAGVDALWIGHFHSYASFWVKDMAVTQLGCFQSQYAWLATKALYPDVMGLIVDMDLRDDGSVGQMVRRELRFRPAEEDWDHEASRKAGRGWSVGESTA